MAKFEGVEWAPHQFQYLLQTKRQRLLDASSKTYAVSRSIHYGLFLVFEGIRFFVASTDTGLQVRFLNLERNMKRFRRGILYSIGTYLPILLDFFIHLFYRR